MPSFPCRSLARVHREPCVFISDDAVHAALVHRPHEYFGFMHRALTEVARGVIVAEAPEKQVFVDAGGGDFRVMPCVTRRGRTVVKTVKIVGTNLAQCVVPDQITVGKLLVLHPRENFVSHIIDACVLSSARTGVCAALAIAALARRRGHLTVIGAGRVGFYTALYAAAAGVNRVTLADRNARRAAAAARALGALCPHLAVAAARLTARHHTDVVALATTSRAPLCAPPAWHADLVVSLGADTYDQHELDPAWARVAGIYVDAYDSLRFGDLLAWRRAGLLAPRAVRDLLSAVANGPRRGDGPRIFISTGSALFDNLTAAYLLSRERRGAALSPQARTRSLQT